uniref:Uncharacterized protein n=1 Tax=Solibacter usitatus (strain Ellin6076) TaxID=234267 RepID=Q01RC2_SOLUE
MSASGICNVIRLAEDGPLVECSTAVLESIRRQAVEGLNAFGHGGLETGGVLYGFREAGRFNIVSFAELPCEHALGPGFILSEKDRIALADLRQPPPGMETLGWYRAHTRSGLALDAHDCRLFESFPANIACAALIVKPTAWGPANAAFFIREPDGRIVPSAASEFLLQPVVQAAQPEASEMATAAPPAGGSQLANRTIDNALPCDASEAETQPLFAPPAFDLASNPDSSQARPRPLPVYWRYYSAAALCILLLLIFWPRSPRNLALAVYGITTGQVRIEWNRGSLAVLQARSATLTISDGVYSRVIPLDPAELRSTSITYSLRTDHISVSLRVQDPGNAAAVEEAVQFVGRPAPSPQPVQRVAVHDPPAAAPEVARAPAEEQTRELRASERRTPSSSGDTPRLGMPVANRFQTIRTMPAQEAPPAALPPPPVISNRAAATVPEVLPSVLHDVLSSVRPVPTPVPAPTAAVPSYRGPRSGRMIWTGVLSRHGVVEIEGNHSNTGSLAGALPGVPVSLRISPSEFGRNGLIVFTSDSAMAGRRESPGVANGWNAVEFQQDAERERGLLILEPPNRANDYNRLVVRSDLRNCAVILIDWAVQP